VLPNLHLSPTAVGILLALFTRQFWVAATSFTVVDVGRSSLQRAAIPISIGVLFVAIQGGRTTPWTFVAGCLVALASLALLEWARITIRGRFFSCLFSDDVPGLIVTDGPYAHVRNPFYASYLLAYLAAAVMLPGVVTISLLVAMFLYYSAAARHEERKFAGSPLADEYERYRRRTGRFVPRLWRAPV